MSKIYTSHWHKKLVEQYLNTFFRETNVYIQDSIIPKEQFPIPLNIHALSEHSLFFVQLPNTGGVIAGIIEYISISGYHRYGNSIFLQDDHNSAFKPLASIDELLVVITKEISASNSDPKSQREREEKLLKSMRNSIEKSELFLKHRFTNIPQKSVVEDFIASEQGLILGHPFHVTSKASSGLTPSEMKCFSPELGASFQLHYFAVVPELIETISSGAEVRDLIDPVANAQAIEILGDQVDAYQLIPSHPWQATYLLTKEGVKNAINKGEIRHLGAMGETVWPTSSVRTVWMPNSHQFLKLSIDVRITNFIRYNPRDQRQRAINVSKLINRLTPQELDPQVELLCEHAAQTLKLDGLDASFGILYRQGFSEEAQKQTRIVASLVEECLERGGVPLFHYIEHAASKDNTAVTADFIASWWERYIKITLVPALKLFADLGISLEAHLQNSLIQFRDGYPFKTFFRDMEGASIAEWVHTEERFEDISLETPIWYSAEECWSRFQYYVVVNHIAHVIAAIARQGVVSEQRLWSVTRATLVTANLSPSAHGYVQRLLNTRMLPAKANLLSTFDLSGEKPKWVEIINPLAIDCRSALAPLTDVSPSKSFHQAEDRVCTQLLESLIFENVLDFTLVGKELKLAMNDSVYYFCKVTRSASFERIRIQAHSLQRIQGDTYSRPSLQYLIKDISQKLQLSSDHWVAFEQELIQTLAKHAQCLQYQPSIALRDQEYYEQESRINTGHLYHPSFKGRIGLSLPENKEYGPELSFGFPLVWIAAHRDVTYISMGVSSNLDHLYRQHFSADEYQVIAREITDKGNKLSDFVLIPVHPWQWTHVIESLYQNLIINGTIIKLSIDGPTFMPQQSVRTLVNISNIRAPSIKLAMSMSNTSTSRIIAPHTLKNCAPISDWLTRLIEDDQTLDTAHKPIILKEFTGISLQSPANVQIEYGTLACIWRESIYQYLSPHQSATAIMALTQMDIDGKPLIDPWIKEYGIDAWLSKLFCNVFIPVIHMLWYHGVALESHAQNMVFVHEKGLPVRVALKDFHDGIRYNKQWLRQPDYLPDLTEAPEAHRRINPNSYLVVESAKELKDFTFDCLLFVNLAELAWFMESHFSFPEIAFWKTFTREVLGYQLAHPELKARFNLFNIFEKQVDIEQLASRRFLQGSQNRMIVAENPLFSALQEELFIHSVGNL